MLGVCAWSVGRRIGQHRRRRLLFVAYRQPVAASNRGRGPAQGRMKRPCPQAKSTSAQRPALACQDSLMITSVINIRPSIQGPSMFAVNFLQIRYGDLHLRSGFDRRLIKNEAWVFVDQHGIIFKLASVVDIEHARSFAEEIQPHVKRIVAGSWPPKPDANPGDNFTGDALQATVELSEFIQREFSAVSVTVGSC